MEDREINRRHFLGAFAASVGGFALAARAGDVFGPVMPRAQVSPAPDWADHIGLELYTVRDLIAKDYVGTLEQVAQIGYKEVEPAEGYANLSPKQFRAELDRFGLTMPSTHSGLTAGPTAEVEQQLAGFQIMGIEYTSLSEPRPAGNQGQARSRAPALAPASPAARRQEMAQFVRTMAQPRSVDDVKQEAARYNEYGKIAQKFGIKLLRHNHTVEFIPCQGSDEVPYTVLLAETDPELVAFQMDIGWASVAGQNPIELFQRHPGRFVLWHVKDAACLKCLPPVPDQGARMAAARLVPVGEGDVDYGEIFKYAGVAGMKHFAVEQDSAADWGDSMAAARVSYEHLRATLTGPA
jgi:sugar phosphate isomerase/epimerase